MPDERIVLPPRQDVPTAWLGRDLAKHPEIWTVTLSPGHVAELELAMAEVMASGIEMAAITKEIFPLPSLGPVLSALRREMVHGAASPWYAG